MKKNIISFTILVAAFTGFAAFDNFPKTAISGKITPGDGAVIVWAINGNDTIRTQVNAGNFSIDVKPGTYKLIVDAKEPFKDVQLENLEVKNDQTLDVGEIILQP
ncbi:MAG: carboxypeptidase-like regulatory domain-containing protein [Chitinophagaceae bacterium]